jgi:hypothetical protein
MRPNFKFVARGLIVALLLLIALLVWASFNARTLVGALPLPGHALAPTLGPTPPPPTLTAPRGELPTEHAGLEEWAYFSGGSSGPIGSGFLLRLPSGEVIGVTTAHSFYLSGWPGKAIDSMAFLPPQHDAPVATFDAFYGPPGHVFTQYHFSNDYALLKVTQLNDEALVLEPDPRGAPQAGERVTLSSGFGDGSGQPRWFTGTVLAVGPEAVWVLMDDSFNPGGMSGSPLFSQHTGKVVGMAVAAPSGGQVQIGFHPIASILQKAAASAVFPPITEYRP